MLSFRVPPSNSPLNRGLTHRRCTRRRAPPSSPARRQLWHRQMRGPPRCGRSPETSPRGQESCRSSCTSRGTAARPGRLPPEFNLKRACGTSRSSFCCSVRPELKCAFAQLSADFRNARLAPFFARWCRRFSYLRGHHGWGGHPCLSRGSRVCACRPQARPLHKPCAFQLAILSLSGCQRVNMWG